ncbi:MAG: YihY family inner membrane protein [Phycisphaerae bacterium]|nr:YihY family inner membrane protein [Phycisphaerae bacterium]
MRRVELPPDRSSESPRDPNADSTGARGGTTHGKPRPNNAVRIGRVLALLYKRAYDDQITMTAAALSYKTLLGLIPILVVVTLVAKTLMGAKFAPFVAGFIQSLGLDQMKITPPSTGGGGASQGPVALGAWVEEIVTQASQVDLSALGTVGVAVTVASAIWLMTSIEMSFNGIYRARQGRGWVKRVVLYWSVLTGGPLLIGAIPLLAGVLKDASDQANAAWIFTAIKTVWDLAVLWVLLLFAYLIVPAARVRVKSAAIGSLLAALIILALKWFLSAYFARAFGISRLYGSLGLIPVFMFWMYTVWLAVLIGLEVTAIAHTLRVRGLDAGDSTGDGRFADPTTLLAVMEEACEAWVRGTPASREHIAATLCIDDRLAGEMLEQLAKSGFLQYTDAGVYVPARPPESFRADEVLLAGIALCAGGASIARADVASALRKIQLDAAATMPVMSGPRV